MVVAVAVAIDALGASSTMSDTGRVEGDETESRVSGAGGGEDVDNGGAGVANALRPA